MQLILTSQVVKARPPDVPGQLHLWRWRRDARYWQCPLRVAWRAQEVRALPFSGSFQGPQADANESVLCELGGVMNSNLPTWESGPQAQGAGITRTVSSAEDVCPRQVRASVPVGGPGAMEAPLQFGRDGGVGAQQQALGGLLPVAPHSWRPER